MDLDPPGLGTVVLLLLLASLVAAWIGHLRVPYTVGLVVVGIIIDLLDVVPPSALSPDVVLWILLPPLLFEAAFVIRWNQLKRVGVAAGVLATVGVVVSVLATATATHFALRLPWEVAILFGTVISATDPVAVVAFFRKARVSPELRTLVDAESLLNDGTVVVLVSALSSALVTGHFLPTMLVVDFLRLAFGGLLVGALVGIGGTLLARTTDDWLVEATITVTVAYGSFLLADQLGVSGVLAVVSAGSVLGNVGRTYAIAPARAEEIDELWEFLAFVANSLVFLLLGIAVVPGSLIQLLPEIAGGVVATWLGRAVVVYGLGFVLARLTGVPPLSWRHVLFWGGLRGALPVVVAIVVTTQLQVVGSLTTLVLGVVVVSLLIQGLTLEPVLERVLRGSQTGNVDLFESG